MTIIIVNNSNNNNNNNNNSETKYSKNIILYLVYRPPNGDHKELQVTLKPLSVSLCLSFSLCLSLSLCVSLFLSLSLSVSLCLSLSLSLKTGNLKQRYNFSRVLTFNLLDFDRNKKVQNLVNLFIFVLA